MGLEIWSHLDAWLPYKCTGHVKTWLNAPVSTFTCGCLGNHTFLGKLLQKWATATVALRNRKVPTKVNNSHKELRFRLYNSLISFPSSHIILSHLLSSSHTFHTSLYHQLKCPFLYKAIPSSLLDLIAFSLISHLIAPPTCRLFFVERPLKTTYFDLSNTHKTIVTNLNQTYSRNL